MNSDALAGMIFVLMIIAMVAGVVVLLPITLRLGRLLERRLEAGADNQTPAAELRQLQASVGMLQKELNRIAERQAFTESLLDNGRDPSLANRSAGAISGPDRINDDAGAKGTV